MTEAIVSTAAELNMQNLVHIDPSPPDFHYFFFFSSFLEGWVSIKVGNFY